MALEDLARAEKQSHYHLALKKLNSSKIKAKKKKQSPEEIIQNTEDDRSKIIQITMSPEKPEAPVVKTKLSENSLEEEADLSLDSINEGVANTVHEIKTTVQNAVAKNKFMGIPYATLIAQSPRPLRQPKKTPNAQTSVRKSKLLKNSPVQ